MKKLLLFAVLMLCAGTAKAQSDFSVPVNSSTTGRAIAGAFVRFTCVSGGCGTNIYNATTDTTGNAQFTGVAPGKYTVTISGAQITTYSYTRDVTVANQAALTTALAGCPSTGCTITVGSSFTTTALSIGSATQHIQIVLNPGVFITAAGSITVASGSSIHGSGSSSSGFICAINTSTPCLLTTRDYETQGYINGTSLTDFSIECKATGCSDGLQNPGLGIGWKISGLQINQPHGACWHVNGATSSDWTEGTPGVGVGIDCTNAGADGFDWDVSSGGFFNDVPLIGSHVRSQKGYFIQATSGASTAISVSRITLNEFHGISTGATQTAQDGIFCNNGGGSASIADWTFTGGEIEGNSQTGYAINGSGANSCQNFKLSGTTENGWSLFYSSPNVNYDLWCGNATTGCIFGNGIGLFGSNLDRGIRLENGDNWFKGGFNNGFLPPYASTLNTFLHGSEYITPTAATTSSIGATTLATAGTGANGSSELMQFSGYVTLTAVGSSCSGTNTLVVTLTFTDPNASGPQTLTQTFTFTNNGTLGQIGSITPLTIQAKATTTVSLSTTYTPAGACSPAPTYKIYPSLELVN